MLLLYSHKSVLGVGFCGFRFYQLRLYLHVDSVATIAGHRSCEKTRRPFPLSSALTNGEAKKSTQASQQGRTDLLRLLAVRSKIRSSDAIILQKCGDKF
eukprot:scaffold7508_cov65-Skeletonema_dohrnii-CCMP3373.AAC.2